MTGVELGFLRNPSTTGTRGLLKIANGQAQDFEIVKFDYYEDNFRRFNGWIKSGGFVGWVVGERGTGKSEALARIFLDVIASNPERPPLPIYISVSQGEKREQVPASHVGVEVDGISMAVFNYACREALREAFEYIREHGEGDFFKTMRSMPWCSDEESWNILESKLKEDDFSLNKFMDELGPTAAKELRLCVCLDDLDKFPAATIHKFFSSNQTDLAMLAGTHKVSIIGSVTKTFAERYRGEPSVDWCLPANGRRELPVPDLSDLTASDIQKFINHRIAHLHYSEDTKEWAFKPEREPHRNESGVNDISWESQAEIVIRDQRWDTFDTRRMRRNGSLLTLNAWMAHRGKMSLRVVLEDLNGVLSSESASRSELSTPDLARILKENNSGQLKLLEKEFEKRCIESKVNLDRLLEEEGMLEFYGKSKSFWRGLLEIAKDIHTIGKAEGPAFRSLNKRQSRFEGPDGKEKGLGFHIKDVCGNFGKEPSATYQFLCISKDLAEQSEFMDGFVSRDPQELFSTIGARQLEIWTKGMAEAISAEELFDNDSIPEATEKGAPLGTERSIPELGDEGETVIFNAYKEAASYLDISGFNRKRIEEAMDELANLDEQQKMDFGEELAYRIFQYYQRAELGTWQGAGSKEFNNARNKNMRGIAKALSSWFLLRCDPSSLEEMQVLKALDNAILNRKITELLGFEKEFQKMMRASPESSTLRDFREIAENAIEEKKSRTEGFTIDFLGTNTSKRSLPALAKRIASEQERPIKAAEKATITVRENKSTDDIGEIGELMAKAVRLADRLHSSLAMLKCDSNFQSKWAFPSTWKDTVPIPEELWNSLPDIPAVRRRRDSKKDEREIMERRIEQSIHVELVFEMKSSEKLVWLALASRGVPLFMRPHEGNKESWKGGYAILPRFELVNPFPAFQKLVFLFRGKADKRTASNDESGAYRRSCRNDKCDAEGDNEFHCPYCGQCPEEAHSVEKCDGYGISCSWLMGRDVEN